MDKKYISELIYNLLEKGYSKEVIIFYITSTVDTNLDLDTIERLYKLSKTKWLKARYIDYENINPVLSEKDKEIQEKLEEEEKLKLIKFKSLVDIRKYEKEKLRELTEEITELKAIYEQYIRR